ncbi:mobile element protein [Mesobacillus boroniphilus JCM 21738]|uniref:Mobile element protein n=1 Tax=Mesobacillus boroniphilus JCM 21738 TaxID=1294265 RepID=W4RWF1_9BACI|nr:mobile element protein [Mesobacillus boroniphilus JCM 21738]
MTDNLRSKCKSLRLAYIPDVYGEIPFENPEQFLNELFQEELKLREKAKVTRLIKKAGFLDRKSLKTFEWFEQQMRLPGR